MVHVKRFTRRGGGPPGRLPMSPADSQSGRRLTGSASGNQARQDGAPPMIRTRSAFTLIELLVVISIISLLISIILPALGQARETGRRAVCGSNLRQIGLSFAQYTQDNESWFPAKGLEGNPNATVAQLAGAQHLSSTSATPWQDRWGPNFSGMIRDIVEKKTTRNPADPVAQTYTGDLVDNGPPQYLANPKILLCPSDQINNRPRLSVTHTTRSVNNYRELPASTGQESRKNSRWDYSFISYFYVALWRNDDRPDWLMMADQSNRDDTRLDAFSGLTPEDNHGTRGMNFLLLDSHVEWGASRDGSRQATQEVATRYWSIITPVRPRYPGTPPGSNRSSEVETIE